MFAELLLALRGGVDSFRYFRHTFLPFSPWRTEIDAVIAETRTEAARYGVDSPVDRRRAYQVARMTIADRRGRHLAAVVPDAYQAFSPPSAATFHSGRRSYPAPAERLWAFRTHPQTLAWLLTPTSLARRGVGASTLRGIGGVESGVQVDPAGIVERVRTEAGSGPDVERWAAILGALAAGPQPEPEETEATSSPETGRSDAA